MIKQYENLKSFIIKHSHFFSLVVLALFCYLFLFFNLSAYTLIDVDETRYVAIAKAMLENHDWVTPYLNGIPFLEKPPLYFWLTVLSYKILGTTSDFASRFPVAMLGVFSVFFTYFFAKKALGQAFGLVSALILLTSAWFLIFTHVAILDLGFMAFSMACIYSVLLTLFCQEKNKKFGWWAGYLFMGLAVLMKGLLGIIIPVLVVFFCFLATKRLKEIFKPINWIIGIPIFLLVVVPWHYAAYAQHGKVWVYEYIIKHHFARFMDSSMGLGRKHSFLYYIPVIFAGFMPWTMSLISAFISGTKVMVRDIKATKRIKPIFSTDTNDKIILVSMSIYFLITLLFFSISSTKLPTYILTAFPPIALLCGYYWWGYISYGKFTRGIVISTFMTVIIFILAGVGGANMGFFVPLPQGIETFRILSAGWIIILSLIALMCLLTKNRALLFLTNVVMMLGVIMIVTTKVFGFLVVFGQDEIIKYANISHNVPNSTLVTFDFSPKYSVLHIRSDKVHFIRSEDFKKLESIADNAKKEDSATYVILKNKEFKRHDDEFSEYRVVEVGEKYTLIVK